jgi:hypothetical protein
MGMIRRGDLGFVPYVVGDQRELIPSTALTRLRIDDLPSMWIARSKDI